MLDMHLTIWGRTRLPGAIAPDEGISLPLLELEVRIGEDLNVASLDFGLAPATALLCGDGDVDLMELQLHSVST